MKKLFVMLAAVAALLMVDALLTRLLKNMTLTKQNPLTRIMTLFGIRL